jgi:hypothetical protein
MRKDSRYWLNVTREANARSHADAELMTRAWLQGRLAGEWGRCGQQERTDNIPQGIQARLAATHARMGEGHEWNRPKARRAR